jgi:hypothetical protein
MVKRKALHIQEDVAQDFRNLATATKKDQSELLRLLMVQGSYREVTTFDAKMGNRIAREGE